MPSTVDGIPLHPLVVHAVVVLLPLAAVGAIVVAVRPTWRRRFGFPLLLIALVGVAAVPVALQTGSQLNATLGPNPLVNVHSARADTLLPFAVGFLALLAVAVLTGRRSESTSRHGGTATITTGSRVAAVAAVLAAVLGIVVTGLVVWIGHSGSYAVWMS